MTAKPPMTTRELFRRIMRFEKPDRTPLWQVEGIADRATLRWQAEGSLKPDQSPYEVIPFDGSIVTIPLNDQPPIPGFKEETLEETDVYVLYRDVHGSLIKVEPGPRLTPLNYVHVDGPLRTLSDWKAMEKRFDPLHPDRLSMPWLKQRVAELARAGAPITSAITWGPARGIKNGYMFGFDRFMEIVALDPEILETVFAFWADYMIALLKRVTDVVPLDAFFFRDDGMGYRNSTLIGPATFDRVYKPHMAKVTAFLHSKGVDTIVYYSSGNLEPILPSLLDIGINTITPVECAAGMQPLALRQKFPELRMIGGISRAALMKGRAAIEEEIRTKIPPLMAQGGFLPAFDDLLMPDMRLEDIVYCAELVRGTCAVMKTPMGPYRPSMLPRLLLDPPAEFGVMPFWFLNDELDEQEICRQLADFADHGVGGVVLHPRIGLPRSLAWMSERLLAFYELAIREAGKRGLRVVLYDEGMYPSGSSAGQVVAENPAYACRCFAQRLLDGDVQPRLAAGENLVAIVARRDGTRLAVVDQPSGSFIRGLHFKRDMDREWQAGAVPDSEGELPPAADLLNPAAVACFLRLVYDRFAARFSRYFGNTVMAIFTDEPYAMSKGGPRNAVPGTTGFLSEVNRLLGYDFTPHLPALWYDDEPDAQIHRPRRHSDAVRQRFEETYYRPLHAWCEKHGLPLTGHPHEPDNYDALRFFHIPGQDLVLRRVLPDHRSALEGRESTQAKCSSSAMLHAGKRRNANEYCGAYGHELTWDEMNWLANWCLVRGVNLLSPHAFYYSVRGPRREERPPDVGPNSPWWARYREHADACRRLCWLNTDSRRVCHVAILGVDCNLPWGAARGCYEHQHDFNYLSERELADGVRVDTAGLHIAGMTYSALIVENEPSAACRPKLRELERLGRAVRYSGSGADALIAELDRLAPRTVTVRPAVPGLRARHVRKEGWHAFILFNECSTPLDTAVELPIAGDCLSFDPATGRSASRRADRSLRMDGHEITVLLIQGVEQ